MRASCFILSLLISTAAWGQWTEPDTTWCPQPGPGAGAPWISNDNLRLYMSNMAEIYVFSRPSPDSAWGPRTLLPPHLNLTPTQRCPAVSPSGDTLYFIGDVRTDCESYGSYDVFFTVRTGPCDTCWGPVQNAGPNVSSTRREFSVGISRDGSMLLVSSTRGGYIDPQLYWHDKQEDGTWGPANIYPPEINDLYHLAGHEHPCLSPDNNRLFFWHTNIMLGDIYVSRKVNGVWQQAVPLPSPPNNWPPEMAATADADPCLAMDGRTLWLRKSFQFQNPYDYHIAVCVDTSDLAVGERPVSMVPKVAVSPNPFNSTTQIEFTLPSTQRVSLRLYDVLGREVAVMMNEIQTAGRHEMMFDASGLPSGVYLCRLEAGGLAQTRKMVLVK